MLKKIIIGVVVAGILIFVSYQIFFKKEEAAFNIGKAERGNIVQEVSESGKVKIGEEINLNFKNNGKIEKIYVSVGDNVAVGDVLARLETSQLFIQIQEAQANLAASQAQFKISQTAVSNSEIALQAVRQNLNDVLTKARDDLDGAYGDALNVLDDSYLKIYNAFEKVKTIQTAYFYSNDQESLKVKENKNIIEASLNQAKTYLDAAKSDSKDENIDIALSETKKALSDASAALTIIRRMCEESIYSNQVSSADKSALDAHRTNINTAQTNTVNSQQAVSSTKITNVANTNAAANQLMAAEGNLEKTKQDVDLYFAKEKQAESQLNLLNSQIRDSAIVSVANGRIAKINKKAGESIQATEPIFSFLSSGAAQIETDIYEEDIVKVKVGDIAEVKLTAFGDKTFEGKVISIDPSEKLVEGVVYYEVTIDLQNSPQELKPGMTADVTIKTAQKDNVLVISGSAVEKRDGKTFVKIIKGEITQEREIETGLKGNDNMVEVVSGLEEGEEIAIPK